MVSSISFACQKASMHYFNRPMNFTGKEDKLLWQFYRSLPQRAHNKFVHLSIIIDKTTSYKRTEQKTIYDHFLASFNVTLKTTMYRSAQ